jgi:nucleoside-diphosphate-sugar epimerase
MAALYQQLPRKSAFAWDLKYELLFHVLNLAKAGKIKNILAIEYAVFGPTTPKEKHATHTIMEPSTVYGISKQAGERWCEYYHIFASMCVA